MSVSFAAHDRPRIGNSNTVFKSGHLLISTRGLGWRSWKKRWFILTRTSLVFFKDDPRTFPLHGGDLNLSLGGIDLNNSGSVVVREDKKLITVLFPDGRDGRAFTLKAETSKDLYEWKTALEQALAQAPNAALVLGHNGIFRNEASEPSDGPFCQLRNKRRPVKSLVVGRPILLALEDVDGGPSFLEKALRFLEKYGTKAEGILRQSADVEEVHQRVHEYEQGKTEFDADEDAHVIGDCVKHILRELPSSPVPASGCAALLEAYRVDQRGARVNSMRSALKEAFPEPNKRLLQRLLKMMHTISSHEAENRMTASAVAACMAPLLLRPLFAGELEGISNINGNTSAKLLAAANAANNAQAIITTLLEDYENLFHDDSMHGCLSTDSQALNNGSEIGDKDPDVELNCYHDAQTEMDDETDIHYDRRHSGKLSGSSSSAASYIYDYKAIGDDDSVNGSCSHDQQKNACGNMIDASEKGLANESQRSTEEISSIDQELHQPISEEELLAAKAIPKFTQPDSNAKDAKVSRKKNARKSSSESIGSSEEDPAIHRLEVAKNDLHHRIEKEARGNAVLQASLERRKHSLHERRLALEQDIARLQEQLKSERDLRAALELSLSMPSGQFSGYLNVDLKTRAELEEIALAEADISKLKQKVAELHHQLNHQRQHHYDSLSVEPNNYQHASDPQLKHFLQEFDTSIAAYNCGRKQRPEELEADLRNIKGPLLTPGSSTSSCRKLVSKNFESPRWSGSKSPAVSTSLSMDYFSDVDSASLPSTARVTEMMDHHQHRSAASSTLEELTTRLDFFKERRAELMEQLQSLDLNYASVSLHSFKDSPPSYSDILE